MIALRALEVLRFMTIRGWRNPGKHHSRFTLGAMKMFHPPARNGSTTLEHVPTHFSETRLWFRRSDAHTYKAGDGQPYSLLRKCVCPLPDIYLTFEGTQRKNPR